MSISSLQYFKAPYPIYWAAKQGWDTKWPCIALIFLASSLGVAEYPNLVPVKAADLAKPFIVIVIFLISSLNDATETNLLLKHILSYISSASMYILCFKQTLHISSNSSFV